MKEENKSLIYELFEGIEKKARDKKKFFKLSRSARFRHQNGRMLDMFLIYLSDDNISLFLVDVKTKVEVNVLDIDSYQYWDMTYEQACEIYDDILEESIVSKEDLKENGKRKDERNAYRLREWETKGSRT